MSAGTCPRCGGDGTIVGRHVKVGAYTVICHLCRGTGNVSGPDNADVTTVFGWALARLYVVLVYRPISRMVRRFGDALDRLGAL